MRAVLISEQASLMARWSEAFPAGKVTGSLKQALRIPKKQDPLYWLDLSSLPQGDWLDAVDTLSVRSKVVVFSAKPTQAEASQFIRMGAMGYCHLGSPVERLQEIALVLEHEGFWMPKEMIQRITQLTRRLGLRKFNPEQDPKQLTGRERAVADLIGLGANNAEIAIRLSMSERTVKAHLTSIFQQLNVRDRVQLALVMNQLPLG
jgi:DNA-binding NarL/FixJ family response regulator